MSGKKKETVQTELNAEEQSQHESPVQAAAAGEAPVQEAPKKKKRGKRKRRKYIAIILIAAVALGVAAVRANMEEPVVAYPVAAGVVTVMDLEQIVSVKGKVEGAGSAEVASSENREITAIYVKEGDMVKAGQVLATIKPTDDDSDRMEPYNKEVAVRNMEAALYDYETTLSLYDEGVIPYQDVLDAEKVYENSVTTVNSYDAPKKVEKNTIESPISGTITRVNAKVGLLANDNQNMSSLFVIEDLSQLKMDVQVSEYNIRNIKVGQTVEITAEVLGKQTAYGVVSYIAPTGEEKYGSTNEMVIPVTIDITDRADGLIAGVSAKASILIDRVEQAVAVPIDALIGDVETGENVMFLIADGCLKKVFVETGLESDFYIQIAEGVQPGDQYVSSPSFDLYDGMEVTVME